MKITARLLFACTGILLTVAHLVYYVINPYDTLYFFLGFGLLWLVFVAPLKYLFSLYKM